MTATPPDWCPCLGPQRPRQALVDLFDECREFVRAPSADEWSDIWFAIGRLLGASVGRPMVPVPFTGRHRDKIAARMRDYGCVRSRRHLRDGSCPSAQAA